MPKLKLLIPRDAIINGFCYSFAEALLKKLEHLVKVGGAFKEGKGSDDTTELTDIAYAVLQCLTAQIPSTASECTHMKPKKLDRYIATVKEFMAICMSENNS